MADIDLGIPGLTAYHEIGVGGFASVYAAHEVEANRTVAVKVLAAMDERGRRRFDRERRTMGLTTAHDAIVTLFRSGYTDPEGRPFLVLLVLLVLLGLDGPTARSPIGQSAARRRWSASSRGTVAASVYHGA